MDDRRWEDVPVDEIHEWITQRVNEHIADALDYLATDMRIDSSLQSALRRTAHRIRIPYVPPEG